MFARWSLLLVLLLSAANVSAREPLTFESSIWPIFRAHCFDCHGATEKLQGDLDLRLVRTMRAGGSSGPAIIPGEPAQSYLLSRLRAGEMPPAPGHISPAEIDTIERWIADGAPTARPEPASLPPGLGLTPEERSFWSFQPIVRPELPSSAGLPSADRVRTPIDALILAEMPPGLTFAPDADRFTLVRRLYLDLLGLPPTPEETEKWLADEGRDWYDRLIAELLASPHYGERWGRHWLDVAGYADSEGYNERDEVRQWAWKYRDWVIRAFNEDMPFDQFICAQLAGDELAGPMEGELTDRQIELLTATGFLRMAPDGTGSGGNDADGRNQVIADTIRIVGASLFGLTLHCAQCHDHRYDPIPHTDYFAIRAIFAPSLDWQAWKVPGERLISLYTAAEREQAAKLEKQVAQVAAERAAKLEEFITEQLEKALARVDDESLRGPLREAYRTANDQRSPDQHALLAKYPFVRQLSPGSLYLYSQESADKLKEFDEKIAAMRGQLPEQEFLRALTEPPNHLPETKLFFRGDHRQPQQLVMPASLTVEMPAGERKEFAPDDESLSTSGRRLALARCLTNPRHPLLARVIVNRVWLHHFGRALVATPSDFGKLGARPTHPDLLDWLAAEFVSGGWSLKHLHRLILTSTVWRQQSGLATDADQSQRASWAARQALDASNRYYWHKPLVRLEAEVIRDRMLAASGQLDRTLYGKPVEISEDETGQVVVSAANSRRSLYIQVRRSRPVALLQAFDAPVMETNCDRRTVSTSATQSLMLINGPFVLEQAAQLAQRAMTEAQPLSSDEWPQLGLEAQAQAEIPPDMPGQVIRAWELAYSRRPESDELALALRFIAHQLALLREDPQRVPKDVAPQLQAMTNLSQTLLSSNEFLYVD